MTKRHCHRADLSRTRGAWMQAGDERFDGDDIQRFYERDKYPLPPRVVDQN